MKRTLLLLTLGIAYGSAAQNVQTFYQDGAWPAYSVVVAATPLDHGSGGENQTWNFDLLVEAGTSESHIVDPTAQDVSNYTGVTHVMETISALGGESLNNRLLWKKTGESVEILGANTTQIELNYSANPAVIGTFPLSFGYNNTDDVAGSFLAEGYSGTFNGTATASVDAYGTLTASIGNFDAGTPVTRLKTVQNLNLIYFFQTVGTVTQTTYSYYSNAMPGAPIFRSTETQIEVPLLSVDYTTVSNESYFADLLETEDFSPASQLVIYPNPATDCLKIEASIGIKNISVYDVAGKQLLSTPDQSQINVAGLVAGTYFVRITTDEGEHSRKFLKK